MQIRQMEIADIAAIVALEQELFSSPWTQADFEYELLKNELASLLVIEEQEIMGYIGMWFLGDQTQITTLGIKKAYQGRQLSKLLMKKCIEITKYLGYNNINLEVRVSNQVAINLYESMGFKIAALRKNYYQDNHEDAFLMIREMEEE